MAQQRSARPALCREVLLHCELCPVNMERYVKGGLAEVQGLCLCEINARTDQNLIVQSYDVRVVHKHHLGLVTTAALPQNYRRQGPSPCGVPRASRLGRLDQFYCCRYRYCRELEVGGHRDHPPLRASRVGSQPCVGVRSSW
jgi:hypothetical protein